MELIESLKNIGLNEKEAKCYLTLLPLRQATAYMIALRSGLKKPTAYVVLESLVNKGFALKIPSQDKTNYIAKSPKECMALARERMQLAQESLPELMAMRRESDDEKVSVAYFEGLDGVKEMYAQLIKNMKQRPMNQRQLMSFSAHLEDTAESLQKYWDELNEQFVKSHIERKAITTKHEASETFLQKSNLKKYLIQVKAVKPEDYLSNITIDIYGNFTQIISHRYLQGILIENPDVAKVMAQIFKLTWKVTKEKSQG